MTFSNNFGKAGNVLMGL